MDKSVYLADSIFQPVSEKNVLMREINKLLFLRTGSFVFGNLNKSAEILSNHFKQGINSYSQINLRSPFDNFSDKSAALIEVINQLIQNRRFKSVGLLMSGGKDSALLAKLLNLNGVEVNAYHVTRYPKDHPDTKTKLENLYKICEKVGVSELNITYGGVSPSNLLESFNYEFFSAPAAAGCANIFLNTNIKSQQIICFAQGADTLSNVVHTQHPYYNNCNIASIGEVKKLIREMYVSTYPSKYRVLGYSLANKIILKNKEEIKVLVYKELQNISRLVGMYLVHTPMDSKYVYKIAKLNNISVFNPFHTSEIRGVYMTSVKNISRNNKIEKIEIEIALKELGLGGLRFSSSGFSANRVSDQGNLISQKQFNKQILSLINQYSLL